MGKSKAREIDLKTRFRIAGHLRRLYVAREFVNPTQMAEKLDISISAMVRYLSAERTVGLDVLLKIHRKLNVGIDHLVDDEPPMEFRVTETGEWPPNPSQASLSSAGTGKQAAGGGKIRR